jgi:hypothetical protein
MSHRLLGFGYLVLVVGAICAIVVFISTPLRWLALIPLMILLMILASTFLPFLRRNITPQQFADELERHLSGTGGGWDWDNTTSRAIRDQRLDNLRAKLPKFDLLIREEPRKEFENIIAALRRGEIPDVKAD